MWQYVDHPALLTMHPPQHIGLSKEMVLGTLTCVNDDSNPSLYPPEDKIELRRNVVPYEKQPWCQGMPPSSKSLAAFVTFFLWIYMLIHRMSIYREIKLLGFVIFIYKILFSFYIFVTWIVELPLSNCIASSGGI